MAKPRTRKTSSDATSEAVDETINVTVTDPTDPQPEMETQGDAPIEGSTEAAVSGEDTLMASQFENSDPVVTDVVTDTAADTPVDVKSEADAMAEDTVQDDLAEPAESPFNDAEAVAQSDEAPVEPVLEDQRETDKPLDTAPTAAPAVTQTVQKVGFFPVVIGGVIAAGLGAAAMLYALPKLPPEYLPQSMQATPVDDTAFTTAIAAQDRKVADLEAKIAALPTPAQTPEMGPLTEALESANAKIAALEGQVATVESQMAALGDRALQSDPAAAAAMEQVQAEISQMKALIEEGRDTTTAAKAQIEAAAEEAAARISGAEAEAGKLRAEAEADAAKSRGRAAVAQLGVAIASGIGKAEAVASVREAGIDVPEAISADVASIDRLIEDFDPAARKALSASRKATAGAGVMDKIGAFLIAQTGVRSLEAQDGDGPDAVLSRAGDAVEGGDLAGALAELEKLPPEGQEAMADWIANAQAHIAATDALGALAQSLN